MRRLVLQMQVSVDGRVSATKRNGDWQVWNWADPWTWDDPLKREFNAIFESVDCILLSRRMVEDGYLDHWGNTARNHAGEPEYAFARRIIECQKVVLTDKLAESSWERTLIARGDMREEVRALKGRPGKDIIAFGGVGFASALIAAGLVEEFQFFVNPAAIGPGRSLFDASPDGLKLRLTDSKRYACGIVLNRYAPRTIA